ncbi:MAG: hypothetical protein D6719_06210 [Candidatus Dadabacteria bacterium]|nr:MAG: hypothetical protein D6719_06210 [Candidatus Dadabacteria bacterium]
MGNPEPKSEFDFKRLLRRGAGAALILNVVGLILTFLMQVVLARAMGAEQYGIYVYVLSWLSIYVLFATAGFDSAVLRYIPEFVATKNWSFLRGLIHRSMGFVLMFSMVVCIINLLLSLVLINSSELKTTFLVGTLLIPIWALTNVRQACLRALKRIAESRFPEMVVRPVVVIGFVLLFKVMRSDPLLSSMTMLLHVAGAMIAFIIGTAVLMRALPGEVNEIAPEYNTEEWLNTSLSLLFVSGMYVLLGESDKIMLGLIKDPLAVGVYAVAVRLSTLVLFGLQAVNTIAAPMISEYYSSRSRQELQSMVSSATRMIFAMSLPLLLGLVLFGELALSMFGVEFEAAYSALLLLCIGQLVNMALGPVGFLLTMTGNHAESMRILVISFVLNVALNIPAIFYYGIEGAAAATATAIAVRNIMTWRKSKELIGVDSSVFYSFSHK